MIHIRRSSVFAACVLVGMAGCGNSTSSSAPAPSAVAAAAAAPQPAQAAGAAAQSGTVAETMNSGGYTYMRLNTGKTDVWVAANEFTVTVGETITVSLDMPMENFHSRTLNRDFPVIYFVTNPARQGEPLAAPAGRSAAPAMVGSHDASAGVAPAVVAPVAAPPGGISIAEAWAKRASLSGTAVTIRGQVVKANNGIMDRNWYHLQDGSGSAKDGTNDLTITTNDVVKAGDIVTVSGTLVTDKDFGAGYAYKAMIENAAVKKP